MTSHVSQFDSPPRFLAHEHFQELFQAMMRRGWKIVGPKIDQGAIVYEHLLSPDDLPRGWTDIQGPGTYRLQRREDEQWFGYVVGPHSWKKIFFPPQATVAVAEKKNGQWEMVEAPAEHAHYALLGVRGCELAAMAIQDKVFLEGPYIDPIYQQRRQRAFIVAVNCGEPAATCFCSSMKTGPRCQSGFDLLLTELAGGFTVEIGTELGSDVLAEATTRPAMERDMLAAREVSIRAEASMQKQMPTEGVRELLLNNPEHPRWDEVADRCLSCTNCTMVCPTCFCSSLEEVSQLEMDRVERRRSWDSCFNLDFSYMNGGAIRNQIKSRYRQWLTHKLASWQDQFGVSGCVGCGRCITWCPVGIDLTEEVAAMRESPAMNHAAGEGGKAS